MKQFFAIIEETFREAIAKKTLIGFFIFSTLIIVIAFFVFQSDDVRKAMAEVQNTSHNGNNNADMMAAVVKATVMDIFYAAVSNILYFFIICVGVFATSGLINSQMEKGTIDLLLSKPVPRWLYIFGRYMGGVLIIALEATWFILGMWVVVSTATGMWNYGFLACAFFITLGFAGIYSIVVLTAVLSRSSALSIIIGIGLFFLNGLISLGHAIETMVASSGKSWLTMIANILYYIFPSNSMGSNMGNLLMGKSIEWVPIFVTIGLSGVYLYLATLAFSKKEF